MSIFNDEPDADSDDSMPVTGVIRVRQSGSWLPAAGLYVKQSGSWNPAEAAFIKQSGVWKQIYPTPAGVLSLVPSSVNLTAYEEFDSDDAIRVTMTNTGNNPLIINNISITQSSSFTTKINYTGTGGATQNISLAVNESKYIDVSITGKSASATSAYINFDYNSGPLGTVTATLPVNGTVNPDYSSITVSPTSVSYETYYTGPVPSQRITISNTGNGGVLNISSITASNGTNISAFPTSIPANGSGSFIITAPLSQPAGTYSDSITIVSDGGTIIIPVTFIVDALSTGTNEYIVAGTYQWTVPTGITSAAITAVGAGGGGGGSTEVGNGGAGGGGGSGAYAGQNISLTPGEVITFIVGKGGAGAPFVGRDPGASGAEGPGLDGGITTISGLFGTITLAGGHGGTSGQSGSGGGGGAGGSPNGYPGQSGQSGTADNSSTTGGNGATSAAPGALGGTTSLSSPTGGNGTRGSGGAGASAPDRVGPYNWAGGNGGDGYIRISW